MKKRKIAISIFAVVSIVSAIVGYSILKQDSHKYDQLAVMVKQDSGVYKRSNMSLFGNNDYIFDHAVCINGTTVTANPNGGVNLTFLGTDKCTIYLKKKEALISDLQAFKDYAKESTNSMFEKEEPRNYVNSISDDNFSKSQQTYTVDTIHQGYYMTYASDYTFNSLSTGYVRDKKASYSLINASVSKYSDIYSSLPGKYIVNYEGHNNSTAAYDGETTIHPKGLDRIYKVVSATANSITYIPSSYTTNWNPNYTTGVYKAEDDYGTSYYFRGDVKNNYIKFGKWTENVYRGYSSAQTFYKEYYTREECQADKTYNYDCNKSPVAGKDMYWRIIRINGDGTLRLLYDGTETHANGTKNQNRIAFTTKKFNPAADNNAYVGYMYGNPSGNTYAKVHANTNPSLLKTTLEEWYEKNFVGTTYANKVGNMSFCNDRTPTANSAGVYGNGVGTTLTFYGANIRLENNYSPSLVCSQKANDLFTSNVSTQGGNGKLNQPVGLLTADEASLVGTVRAKSCMGNYLNKGWTYWLGSAYYHNGDTYEFLMGDFGILSCGSVEYGFGVAPVINLRAEYIQQLKGSGTMDDPYTL